jgi:S1-C subfamily serine protease
MNFFLAFLIFTGLFVSGARPVTILPDVTLASSSYLLPTFDEAESMGYITYSGIILTPLTGSLASQAGVMSGDVIREISGVAISSPQIMIDIVEK